MITHLCDISNPTKPWELCKKWTNLLFVEFYAQGDKEKAFGLPISFLMDKETTNIPKSQQGFIKNLILPAFESVKMFIPEIDKNLSNLSQNLEKWVDQEDDYYVLELQPPVATAAVGS